MGKGVEYDDLFQAGCVGLVKAAEHFDPTRGVKFSTYAVPVILGEIRRLFRDGGAFRVSRGLRELGQKVRQVSEQLRETHGRSPTIEDIAETLGITPERAALALGALRQPVSLTDSEEGGQLEIPIDAPEERMTEHLTLHTILRKLEEPDRKLIEYRYFQAMTQSKTAELLGMTQVQVSRREKKLLAYMREEFSANS